jgi:eukaryotic-like serine/threonine-protein kinase
LNAAKIPMISSTASDDQLSGQSQYFFRIAPRNLAQAHIEALYAHQKGYQRIVVFATQDDSYSTSLAADFSQDSTISASIIDTKYYHLNNRDSIKSAWDAAQKEQPDLIFFAGQASDVSSLLSNLPPCPDAALPSCLKVLGGDALYVLGDYSHAGSINYNRLSFTSFAFPDEWAAAHFSNPPFFGNYARTFAADETHSNQYGWERPDADVILGYDAVGVVLYAHNLDAQNLLAGLNKITGHQACQGISGRIDFQNGDPVDKAIVMLTVSAEGLTKMAPMSDQFYQNQLGYKLPFCQ